ncbi:MAG TPA: thioredoxin domain-containing protein [Burkholderiales bacterium]|nr:thioredoxin domain-containing protein [Burkholderiales bacterium]
MRNRLATETSPYLQQHADNPVDWYPWGEEALALSREQDKPILLSIGYSACHWCHVMSHESFEDADTAAEMNRLFVNVKVDREERPDLDQIYQAVHQMLVRRAGGWPLTMFLTPAGTPFFAGTYFPKTARYGMPAFKDLLARVAGAWQTQRNEIERQSAAILDALGRAAATQTAAALDRVPIDAVVGQLGRIFDTVYGGIGDKPKFPHPYELAFCLRRHALDGGTVAGEITKLTATRMAEGGLFDHLGGGFCRYSTDRTWTIPHFEKMLYDNGPLLALYSDAWAVWRDPLFAQTAQHTADWVMREMQSPEGGYYSSLDADSEGEEGRFYVWTREEVQTLLTEDEFAVAAPHYGVDAEPNFEGRHWHLHAVKPLEEVAGSLGLSRERAAEILASARGKLYGAREARVRPGRDDKVLTSWNALMIKGMARAGRVFGRYEWIASARRAADFLRGTLCEGGRLLATYKDGRAHLNAYLDDYAFLVDALLELAQSDFRADDLAWARELADVLIARFEDTANGGFWFTSHDHEKLIQRPKSAHDGATPSGNGVAAHALQRLAHLTGEPRYLEAAQRAIAAFYEDANDAPSAHVSLLTALEESLVPPRIVVVRGDEETALAWHAALAQSYRPDTMVIAIGNDAGTLPATLDHASPASGAAAWICEGAACRAPVHALDDIQQALGAQRAG